MGGLIVSFGGSFLFRTFHAAFTLTIEEVLDALAWCLDFTAVLVDAERWLMGQHALGKRLQARIVCRLPAAIMRGAHGHGHLPISLTQFLSLY